MQNMVEVENLVKIFYDKKRDRSIHAVDGMSFALPRGEIFGFLGPNGAGKTTTIRVLAGLLKPTSGHAMIFDKDVMVMGDRIRQYVGFLTENHGNYENLTVYDNLKFFGGFYKISNLEERIDAVLKELELTDRKFMKVGKLSKGLKQRSAIARVLIHDPRLIFLDEPTSGLDPQAAVNVRNIIRGLKNSERTIFINSHNLEEVQKICDRVAIISKGKIVRMGTSSELSKEIFGSQELIVSAKNTIANDIVKQIEQFEYVEHTRQEKENGHLYIHLKDIDEGTPEIVEFLVKQGVRITEVKRETHSLEEIYLTLMSEKDKKEVEA